MSRRKTKRNICSVHYEIKELAEDIEEEFKQFMSKKALKQILKIQVLADEALEYGQSMENRLQEYRNAVDNLGFVRKK